MYVIIINRSNRSNKLQSMDAVSRPERTSAWMGRLDDEIQISVVLFYGPLIAGFGDYTFH